MSTLKTNRVQLGQSGTATQNFTLTADAADGTMKLARGVAGATTQDILTINALGEVDFPQLVRSYGASGYQKLPGGLIIQWGDGVTNGSGVGTVTFPINFPNAIFQCYAADRAIAAATANAQIVSCNDGSVSGMTVYSMNDTGVAATSQFKWFAIGN